MRLQNKGLQSDEEVCFLEWAQTRPLRGLRKWGEPECHWDSQGGGGFRAQSCMWALGQPCSKCHLSSPEATVSHPNPGRQNRPGVDGLAWVCHEGGSLQRDASEQ